MHSSRKRSPGIHQPQIYLSVCQMVKSDSLPQGTFPLIKRLNDGNALHNRRTSGIVSCDLSRVGITIQKYKSVQPLTNLISVSFFFFSCTSDFLGTYVFICHGCCCFGMFVCIISFQICITTAWRLFPLASRFVTIIPIIVCVVPGVSAGVLSYLT